MKIFAFILSFYIISIAAMPMAKLVEMAVASQDCAKKCCKHIPERDADGCNKACSPFSCCLKTLALFKENDESIHQFIPQNLIKNNFSQTQMFTSLHGADIWHPPRFI